MDALAAIRPDDWNFVLLLHILGAMVTVGGLVLAGTYLWGAARSTSAATLRLGYRALLWVAIPGYLVMRVFAQLIYDKEHLDDLPEDPQWVEIGFIVAEPGLLLLVGATVLTGLATRRATAAGPDAQVAGGTQVRVASALVLALLAAYGIALWAMTAKPV